MNRRVESEGSQDIILPESADRSLVIAHSPKPEKTVFNFAAVKPMKGTMVSKNPIKPYRTP